MERKTLLITRPLEGSEATLKQIQDAGYQGMIHPLLTCQPGDPFGFDASALQQVQGVLITSQQSLRADIKDPILQEKPLYVVGEQTAALAKAKGFKHIGGMFPTAQDLFHSLLQTCRPEDGDFLYLSGETIQVDLPGLLRHKGFKVIRHICYRMVPAQAFSPDLVRAFKAGQIQGVLLLSSQTAKAFSFCIQQANLGKNLKIVYLFCMSQAVAEMLACLENAVICTANQPNLVSLMETIDETFRS